MLTYETVEDMLRKDFEQFTTDRNEPINQYAKKQHLHMATRLTLQAFDRKTCYVTTEVDDFIHGLNHVFFFGVIAGKALDN